MNLFHYILNLVKFSSQANEVIKTRFTTFPKIFFLLLQTTNVCYGKDSYYLIMGTTGSGKTMFINFAYNALKNKTYGEHQYIAQLVGDLNDTFPETHSLVSSPEVIKEEIERVFVTPDTPNILSSQTGSIVQYSFNISDDERIHLIDTPGLLDTGARDPRIIDAIRKLIATRPINKIILLANMTLNRAADPRTQEIMNFLTALVNSDLDSYIHFVGTKSQNTRLANRWTANHLTFSPASVTAIDMEGLTPFYPDDYTSAEEFRALRANAYEKSFTKIRVLFQNLDNGLPPIRQEAYIRFFELSCTYESGKQRCQEIKDTISSRNMDDFHRKVEGYREELSQLRANLYTEGSKEVERPYSVKYPCLSHGDQGVCITGKENEDMEEFKSQIIKQLEHQSYEIILDNIIIFRNLFNRVACPGCGKDRAWIFTEKVEHRTKIEQEKAQVEIPYIKEQYDICTQKLNAAEIDYEEQRNRDISERQSFAEIRNQCNRIVDELSQEPYYTRINTIEDL